MMRRFLILLLFAASLSGHVAAAHRDDLPLQEIIDSGDSLIFFAWSPDGTWIAYFTNDASEFVAGPAPTTADLHLRNHSSGQNCSLDDVPLGSSYRGIGVYAWVSDNRLLSMNGGVQMITPCTATSETIGARFPQPIFGITDVSPDQTKVLFSGRNVYFLYDLPSATVHLVTGITPNNLAGSDHYTLDLNTRWSPDGSQIAAQVNGSGSVYLIDAQTGKATPIYNEPMPTPIIFGEGSLAEVRFAKRLHRVRRNDDRSWGAPQWLSSNLLFIRTTLSQGALILSTDGTILMHDGDQRILAAARFDDIYRVLLIDSANQQSIFSSDTGTAVALDPQDEIQRSVIDPQSSTMEWSPDRKRAAFGSGEAIVIRTGDDLTAEQRINFPDANDVRPTAWSPDGSRLAVVAYYAHQTQVDLVLVNPR